MRPKNDKRTRLIITEADDQADTPRTTRARSELHRLIAQFRKDAETLDDPGLRMIFEVATEILTSLAIAFQTYENYSAHKNESGNP